jgi:hypothetical protein
MNILNKRTLMIVGLSAVAIGMLRKYAKDPANKDSFVTKIADSVGLTA